MPRTKATKRRRGESITVLIPLPRFYNPEEGGQRRQVEEEEIERTAREIAEHFEGGGTYHPEPVGFWWDRGIVGRDVLALLEVDIPDTKRDRDWLESYARRVLLSRFRQRAIYLKFVGPVETLVVRERIVKGE